MDVLESRLNENKVIEKVYLKELERKRDENKVLKEELKNYKYPSNLNEDKSCNITSSMSSFNAVKKSMMK